MTKGDAVTYKVPSGTIRAIVDTMHKDGSVTVRAMFFTEGGKDAPGHLGFKVRLEKSDLVAA